MSNVFFESRFEVEALSREAARAVYVGDHTALCRVLGFFKMYVDTRDIMVAANLMLDGCWEPWVTAFLSAHVQKNDTCINVGANYGYFALLLADLVEKDGQVTAFEPNPDVFSLLRRNRDVSGMRHLDLLECAVGNVVGTAPFSFDPEQNANGRLLTLPVSDEIAPQEETITVGTVTLDSLHFRPVDWVVVDAEGAEPLIWEGMQKVIAESPKIKLLLEFAPSRYKDPLGFARELADTGTLSVLSYHGEVLPIDPGLLAAGKVPGVSSHDYTVLWEKPQ